MKACLKLSLLLMLLITGQTKITAQIWTSVGIPAFSSGSVSNTWISIDKKSGTPYVVFSDVSNGSTVTVMKYDGHNWAVVGEVGFSIGSVSWPSIYINESGTPYVAYSDEGIDRKAVVKKFNGFNWETVGTEGFSLGGAKVPTIIVDGFGTPYVLFGDRANSTHPGAATVMKFDGVDWVIVGSSGFSGGDVWGWQWFAIDKHGTPYIVYEDGTVGQGPVSVMKYDGTNWVIVGNANFADGDVLNPCIAIDHAGTPYVLYRDCANGNAATVKKFDGSSWLNVGVVGFSIGEVSSISMAIDTIGTPFVAFSDFANGERATVMKLDKEGSWEYVGTAGFSAGKTAHISVSLDRSGTPHVAYIDFANGAGATVMKLNTGNGIGKIIDNKYFTITPNPSESLIEIVSKVDIFTLEISNVIGQTVYSRQHNSKTVSTNVAELPKGLYIVCVNGSQKQIFIKQ